QRPTANMVVSGTCFVLWGFVLKCVLADSLALVTDLRFETPEAHHSLSLFLGILFYAFQIYGDFAGYSLIAIGLARILGFDFPLNFDRPYFSRSFSEFWQRWHISLSSWLRDYLYIPLGGNRKGVRRTTINLLLTMLLGGLWHGAAWTFVVWGGLHGVYLCGQRWLAAVKLPSPLRIAVPALLVFGLTLFAWIFFRAESLPKAIDYLSRLLTNGDWTFGAVTQKFHVLKGVGLILLIAGCEALSFRINFWKLAERHRWLYGAFVAICLWMLALLGTFGADTFIYFQF
ncbi:MAG: MBOAT family O-acyltransferase, partial [Verrucomicrobiota bacterium]